MYQYVILRTMIRSTRCDNTQYDKVDMMRYDTSIARTVSWAFLPPFLPSFLLDPLDSSFLALPFFSLLSHTVCLARGSPVQGHNTEYKHTYAYVQKQRKSSPNLQRQATSQRTTDTVPSSSCTCILHLASCILPRNNQQEDAVSRESSQVKSTRKPARTKTSKPH